MASGEILIRGGQICDGTGRTLFPADVLVRGGAIEQVGPGLLAPAGARVLEAGGQIVAPGFIDLHSHADLLFPLPDRGAERLLAGRILQGITTEIVGNCGLGPAPASELSAPLITGILAWMTPAGGARSWTSLGAYLDAVEEAGPPLNVGALLPHGAVRLAAMGLRAGPPHAAEARQMVATVERGLEEGAFGLSTGLIYPPGMFSDTEELIALGRPVACSGRLMTSHVRGSSELLFESVEELLRIGREAGCQVHHSHSEAVGRAHWRKIETVLQREEAARHEGIGVSFDMFPYTVAATMMLAIYPPWALEGGVGALLARLRAHRERERIRLDIEELRPAWPPWSPGGWPHNLVSAVGWEGIAVSRVASAANRRCEGMTLAELGKVREASPFDAICDLMIEEDGEVGQWVFQISGTEQEEDGLLLLAADPAGAFCTDAIDTGRGLPHPAAYGAFPRVLARLVREKKVLKLEDAIRKMTGYPAELLGLSDRGRIAAGAQADIVVFDPEAIEDNATLSEPRLPARGISEVLINGIPVVTGSRYIGEPAGKVLRAG